LNHKLAFRFYKIGSKSIKSVTELLSSTRNKRIPYSTYLPNSENIELYFQVKKVEENDYGKLIEIYLDVIKFFPEKESTRTIKITPTYTIQLFEKKNLFKNHLLFFGDKSMDFSIRSAFKKFVLSSTGDEYDPIIKIKPDFKKIQSMVKEFPNVHKFCVKNIDDDKVKGIVVSGLELQEDGSFERYVLDDDTKGDLNFIALSIDKKMIYVNRDGSFYSREDFSRTNSIELIYNLLKKFDEKKYLFKPTIDDFL